MANLRWGVFLMVMAMALFGGCGKKTSSRFTLFNLLPPEETGVEFVNRLAETEDMNIIDYLYFNNGAGVAAGDINNDGLIDLYFSASQEDNRLYLNTGSFSFKDITGSAGVAGSGDWKTGVSMADVNGDGYLDIYVCQVSDYKGLKGGNQLFINNGDLTFADRTREYGLAFQGFSTQSVFFDYDLDGDLDMFLLNHSVHSVRSYGEIGLREEFDPRAGDRFFRNDLMEGGTGFTDITQQTGIYSSQIGYGLNVSAGDLNSDGYPDLYVSNDFHENDYLYMNNGDGTFTDRFTEMMAYSSRSSMGNDIADFNNDAIPDVIVLDMLPAADSIRQRAGGEDDLDVYQIKRSYGYHHQFVRNTLQLNLGSGMFSEIGRFAGIHATDWSWSPLWCDLDNDGWKDLYITNGIFRRPNDLDYIRFLTLTRNQARNQNLPPPDDKVLYEQMPLDKLVNYAFRNNRDFTFTDKALEWGLDIPSFSNGAAYADLDNDGDLDLVVNNINDPAFIFRNNGRDDKTGKNFITLRLRGEGANTFGIGTRVILYHKGVEQMAENFLTRGFFSSVPPEIHFGLDSVRVVDSIGIRWPGKKVRMLYDVPANRLLEVDVSMGKPVQDQPGKDMSLRAANTFFRKEGRFTPEIRHRENNFLDFAYEKLMPHQLSREGPCIAVGDVNGDGLDDVYFGGAANQPGSLLIQSGSGGFTRNQESLFRKDMFFEDVDAGFFDADNDGDPDLFIVSGGNEYILPNPFMRPRLYLNQGDGNFVRADKNLPALSHNGSCFAHADVDGDGDTDIFLGSRSIPRAYGISPSSFLLINNGKGFFAEMTEELAPELLDPGMVTDAVWTDVDQDNDPDLVITGEWMPVTVLANQGGRLQVDSGSGTDQTGGWWFSLGAADLDGDGDEDLVAGNLGLNAYLTASRDYPTRIYINDFDQDGLLDQIITSYKEGREYPFAPADNLFDQIPALRSMFKDYADFAGTTIQELFPAGVLEKSIVREVHSFESSFFINNGAGTFNRFPLPSEIQFAPVMDILIADLDLDQRDEMLIGGNFTPVIPYFGQYDASYGWLVRIFPGPEFSVIYPGESGFQVKGEIRDMDIIRTRREKRIVVGINDQIPEIFTVTGSSADSGNID